MKIQYPLLSLAALLAGCISQAQTSNFNNVKVAGTLNVASQTANGVVYSASGGNLTTTATGNSGQVLTSNGSGAAPTFQASSGGGGISGATSGRVVVATGATTGTTYAGLSSDTNGNLTARSVSPFADAVDALGGSSLRWNSIYISNGILVGPASNVASILPFAGGGANNGIRITDGLGFNYTFSGGLIFPPASEFVTYGLVYEGSGGYLTSTLAGTAGQVLTSNGSGAPPTYQAVSGTGTVTSITAGTGLTGGTITSSGTIALSSPVSVANGGTGVTSISTGNVPFGNGAGPLSSSTNFRADSSGNVAMVGNVLVGGYISFNPTMGILGDTGSMAIPQGTFGYANGVGLNNGSAVSITSGTPANMISHLFPAGRYLVWSSVWFSAGTGATMTSYAIASSTASLTLPGINSPNQTQKAIGIAVPGIDGDDLIQPHYFLFTAPTTIYIVVDCNFSGGTMATYGGMSWIQMP